MTAAIITDIEGTTSSIAFVKDVLFPYARRELPDFVRHNAGDGAVREQLEAVWASEGLAAGDVDAALAVLDRWIAEDRKATPLKSLQGMVWKAGYENGDYRAHVYDDAAEALRGWHARGLPLYVYSSGSVLAQRLFFAHSEAGDLTPLFSGHFDTTIGAKRDAESYRQIAERIGAAAGELLFLSDVEAELEAAYAAGMVTCHVVRDGQASSGRHPVVGSLAEVDV